MTLPASKYLCAAEVEIRAFQREDIHPLVDYVLLAPLPATLYELDGKLLEKIKTEHLR